MAAPRILAGMASPAKSAAPPRLWDPVVRMTHWGIASAVLLNALITKGGSVVHVSLGWVAMALLLLRLIWGVLGTREALFAAFPPNPAAAFAHLGGLLGGKRQREYPSHNPAGALMVYAFWITLASAIATGLVMTSGATPMRVAADKAAVASGDWSALIREGDDDEGTAFGKATKEVHEVAANLLLILAALHVAGVYVEGRVMRRNLVAPMLFGAKDTRRK